MNSKTITDRAGDTLRLSTGSLTAGPGEITVKVSERFRGREEVAAVHVDPAALRAALDEVAPAGSYARTDEPLGAYERHESPDYADGGVAAALIEQEAQGTVGALIAELEHHRARAEKAERERDEARRERDSWRAQVPLAAWEKDLIQATENPRPLPPTAVTDEMVGQFRDHMWDVHDMDIDDGDAAEALRAALTEPPARPEWADLREALDWLWPDGTDGIAREDIARRLHTEAGVRVVGEEQS